MSTCAFHGWPEKKPCPECAESAAHLRKKLADVFVELLRAQQDAAAAQAQLRQVVDRLYNFNAAARMAVIEVYGLHHKPVDQIALRAFALKLGQAVYAATDNNGEFDPANGIEAIVDRVLKGDTAK